MAAPTAMFVFEVVLEHIKSFVDSRLLVVRAEFADIFSLELKDPKQMHIVMPEPLPLPPEPPGKKKKKPPKPKKPKKGALPPPPPPEPVIQSGQSVLFTSSADILIKVIQKFPMQITVWSKEDNLVFIGQNLIPWDPLFISYLEEILRCGKPKPVTLNDEYNVFEEDTAKLMCKVGLQIKLTYLGESVTTAFRTLSEDPTVKKVLYTGINSKTTSFICTLKTTDEVFAENCNKLESNFEKDTQKDRKGAQIVLADYTNAPGANLVEFSEGDYCCMGSADKPPESKYTAPNTVPTIDFIIDYVRKIIASCNDNMRMLTPRPTITPRVRGTDIDRLCYCKQSHWPPGELAKKYKIEVQSGPCAICADQSFKAGPGGANGKGPGAIFDIANIRGPCGKPECKIARHMRKYIENLIEEDKMEVKINDIVGPCGSQLCTMAQKIQEFLRHEGVFAESTTKEGLSTQCACIQKMQDALTAKQSCQSICSKDCEEADGDPEESCTGKDCPFTRKKLKQQVYNVYYFTVELDKAPPDSSKPSSGKTTPTSGTATPATGKTTPTTGKSTPTDKDPSGKTTPTDNTSGKSTPADKTSGKSTPASAKDDKFRYCAKDCPSMKAAKEITLCTNAVCPSKKVEDKPCPKHPCPVKGQLPPSPKDSHIEIRLGDIRNPCCATTCDVAEQVKGMIVDGLAKKERAQEKSKIDNECYCDCVCDFNFTKDTTYCGVCGGYECLGADMESQPAYIKPLPCPIYHKLYDKKYIKTENPFPDDDKTETLDKISIKTTRSQRLTNATAKKDSFFEEDSQAANEKKKTERGSDKKSKTKKTAVDDAKKGKAVEEQKPSKYPYPPVPANMGWNWTAEDIPGLKVAKGWKPGAVSKCILRKLRRAKLRSAAVGNSPPVKKPKTKCGEKPTLVIKKVEGEYTVEMQVTSGKDQSCVVHDPLIYKIASASNEEKVQRRERKAKRMIKKMVKEFEDPYHPEVCQRTCEQKYREMLGVFEDNEPPDDDTVVSDSCSCEEDDQESDDSSLDVDWEIQFSPPKARAAT